jgi:lysozyme
MTEESCGTCFFHRAGKDDEGECHAHPPLATSTSNAKARAFALWPIVAWNDWCGEYEPAAAEAAEQPAVLVDDGKLKTSDKGMKFLAELEGVVLVPYKDSAGVWTICVGHTASAGPPNPQQCGQLTGEQCRDIFATDLVKYEERVRKYVTAPMAQWEFDSFVSFDYNTGAIDEAVLVDEFNQGDKEACYQAFMNWTTAGGDPNALTSRREKEQKLFKYGDYSEPFTVAVWEDKYPGPAKSVTI